MGDVPSPPRRLETPGEVAQFRAYVIPRDRRPCPAATTRGSRSTSLSTLRRVVPQSKVKGDGGRLSSHLRVRHEVQESRLMVANASPASSTPPSAGRVRTRSPKS